MKFCYKSKNMKYKNPFRKYWYLNQQLQTHFIVSCIKNYIQLLVSRMVLHREHTI